MADKEYEKWKIRTKEYLHRMGFKCMVTSSGMLVLNFILLYDGHGGVRLINEYFFWGMQVILTVDFIIGALGYLVSLAIKNSDTLES